MCSEDPLRPLLLSLPLWLSLPLRLYFDRRLGREGNGEVVSTLRLLVLRPTHGATAWKSGRMMGRQAQTMPMLPSTRSQIPESTTVPTPTMSPRTQKRSGRNTHR